MAERLVALNDASEPEVMLEVEILEIKTSRLTELGIAVPPSITLTPLAANGGALTLRGLRGINSDRIGVAVGDVVLNLRREVGDFNILANPRVRTKSREKAHIVIGDRLPIVTSTATATGLISENISYVDVGLKLDVEPVVSEDDDVTMKVGLEVSSVTGAVQTERSLAYQIGTRNANTVLRLRDGETQILGGLISNDDRINATRIPGLGDLPIAGRLFSSQKDDFQRTELVLAITPRVLRSTPRLDASDEQLWVGTDARPRLREFAKITSASHGAATGTPAPTAVSTLPKVASTSTPNAETAQPQGQASLEWKPPATAKPGEVFTVPLLLDSSTPLRGALIEIAFPARDVELVQVDEAAFFKQDGASTNFTQSVRGAEGRASIGILRNDTTGAQGRGAIAELKFRATKVGAVEVRATSFRPIGVGAAMPLPRVSSVKINVE
jgi:general secretion pathway protein D